MKRLLKGYLVLALALQFLLAGLVDFSGHCIEVTYQSILGVGAPLPGSAAFAVSIRPYPRLSVSIRGSNCIVRA